MTREIRVEIKVVLWSLGRVICANNDYQPTGKKIPPIRRGSEMNSFYLPLIFRFIAMYSCSRAT